MPNLESKNYIDVDKVNEVLKLEPDTRGNLAACIFQVSQIQSTNRRPYKTTQDVLDQAGGLANVGLAVILVNNSILKYETSPILDDLFDIHPISPKETTKKKRSSKKQGDLKKKDMEDIRDGEKDRNKSSKPDNAKAGIEKSKRTSDTFLTLGLSNFQSN